MNTKRRHRGVCAAFLCAAFLCAALASGCVGAPPGVEPLTGFEPQRYLGTWYEIARLDHSFERGLTRVSAHYSTRADGGLDVLNRGFDPAKGEWREARGRAYFTGGRDTAALKVSFFGPFYGGYNVIALDRADYGYALVCGPDRSYLWILARTPRLDATVRDALVARARELGFDTGKLIYVEQPAPEK